MGAFDEATGVAGRPPIDAVVTWVDGADPDWSVAFREWAQRIPDTLAADGRHPARYRQHGELRFVLRSIWSFAPWIRRIHLVTSGHVPAWVAPHPRLRIVTHDEILGADARPTFNSHAIEARLHHVRGLAEHFVYLNDDVFFGRPQRRDEYVAADGRVRIPVGVDRLPEPATSTGAAADVGALNALALLRAEGVALPPLRPGHGPVTNRRTHLFELETRFAPALATTAGSRFRSATDIPLPTFLAPVDALASGRAEPANLRIGYVGLDDADLGERLADFAGRPGVDAFCLNDTERVPHDAVPLRRRVERFLRAHFPHPAPWEVDEWVPAPGLTATAPRVPTVIPAVAGGVSADSVANR